MVVEEKVKAEEKNKLVLYLAHQNTLVTEKQVKNQTREEGKRGKYLVYK